MKKIIIFILIIYSFKSYSQLNKKKPETHKINLHLIKQHDRDLEIVTLRPINRVKFTFKAGLNYSNNKDLEFGEFYQMIGYEYRIKYYINKKLRIVFKDQVLTIGQDNYYLGFQIKF